MKLAPYSSRKVLQSSYPCSKGNSMGSIQWYNQIFRNFNRVRKNPKILIFFLWEFSNMCIRFLWSFLTIESNSLSIFHFTSKDFSCLIEEGFVQVIFSNNIFCRNWSIGGTCYVEVSIRILLIQLDFSWIHFFLDL